MDLVLIFIAAAVTNNFVLSYFLGICPFIGVSNRVSSALGMGAATTFVMTMAATLTWLVYNLLLIPTGYLGLDLNFLQYVSFILIIASLVQLVEMFLRKMVPALYRALGIYLPLITTNCAILGLTLFIVLREYTLMEAVVFGVGAGAGFTMVLTIMAGIREQLDLADVPESARGAPITLIVAGFLALAFMGFAGLLSAG